MEQHEGWYQGAGGAQLYCRTWRPPDAARAVVIALHGLGDHSGLYPMLGESLLPRGITVHAPDLRGNGRSPGQRGYVGSIAMGTSTVFATLRSNQSTSSCTSVTWRT